MRLRVPALMFPFPIPEHDYDTDSRCADNDNEISWLGIIFFTLHINTNIIMCRFIEEVDTWLQTWQ